jgi:hypothetical protein
VTSAAIAAEVSSHVRLAIAITAKLPRINSVALLQGVMISSLGFTALHAGFGETSASMQRAQRQGRFFVVGPTAYQAGRLACPSDGRQDYCRIPTGDPHNRSLQLSFDKHAR